MTCVSFAVSIIAADALVTQGAMVLVQFPLVIPAPALKGLIEVNRKSSIENTLYFV